MAAREGKMHAYPPFNPTAGTTVLRSLTLTTHTHLTAPTQFVDANGVRFAYRRFGKTSGVPIVMNTHFRGTMDHWDPVITDGLAEHREVILFDNAGVGASSGEVTPTFSEMATDA